MGEAKRKREEIEAQMAVHEAKHVAKHGPLTEYQRHMKELHIQGQEGMGAFELLIVRRDQLDGLVGWVRYTDDGHRFADGLRHWYGIMNAGKKPLCAFCDHEFETGWTLGAFMFVQPIKDGPTVGLGSGICEGCCRRSDAELEQLGFQAMVKLGLANREMGLMRPGSA